MPNWLDDKFFVEMCSETRETDGWDKRTRKRNEAWDLSYYAIAAAICPLVGVEKVNWANPPGWAEVWDKNDLVAAPGAKERFAAEPTSDYELEDLGRMLA